MGIGFIGLAAEPGNKALDDFIPMVTESAQAANVSYLLDLYDTKGISIGALSGGIFSHWAYHGVYFGILSLFFWYKFSLSIDRDYGLLLFVFFLGLTGSLAYESIKSLPVLMLLLMFNITYLRGKVADGTIAD